MISQESKISYNNLIKEYALLIIGCFITAFASNSVLKPNGLSTSGITGLSIVLESVIGINYSYIYYAFTVVIIVATLLLMGKKEVLKIILLSVLYPTFLVFLQKINIEIILDDPLLVVVCFSVLYGVGVGIVLRLNYSYGGTDTIAKIIYKKLLPFVNISYIMLILDGLIIIFTGFVLGVKIAIYGLIIQFLFTKVIDYVMSGVGTKLYKHEIISEKHHEISEYIMKDLKRGVTLRIITGAYTNTQKVQLCCVCSPKESVDIRRYLASVDKNAYVEVIPIISVWGIGTRFKRIDED